MVMEVVHEDMGEDSMQCTNHPYKNSTPGGICAFCLQEKLGKLVSSSYPVPVFPSSSSSSPSFRSAYAAAAAATSAAVRGGGSTALQNGVSESYSSHTRRSKLPFVLTHRKKKKKESSSSTSDSTAIVFKRSKSTATPRRGGGNNNIHLLDEEDYNSPNRRGFWSFLHLPNRPKKLHHHHHLKDSNFTPSTPATVCNNGGGDENGSPDDKFSDRKVSRSRSVGCGSRSFSGDFFERISTGFGDCTLRRVESQREGKPKNGGKNGGGGGMNGQDYIKERVKCGGLFSGFMIAGSSSSSSSSSSYWVAGNSVEENSKSQMVNLSHGRSKSWGWAFASPMRAFSKNININNSGGKRDADLNNNKNRSPNLSAIPSLLAVSG